MLERGSVLPDEDETEAGACGTWEWQDVGDVWKGEERWLTSVEEEEIMEEEADEEQTSVRIGGDG